MKRILVAITAWVIAITGTLLSQQIGSRNVPRELIIHNAKVVTLDKSSRIVSALAIRGDHIVAVGNLPEVRASVGPSAELLDAGGRTLVPGMIDTHAHLDMQALATLRVEFAGAKSIPAILSRIKAQAERQPAGTWIVTEPIGEPPHWFNMPEGLAEKRFPDRRDLDTVAPNHPVFIRAPLVRSLAVSIANSLALKEANITRNTTAPPGVTILKDASGEPTGIFEERSWPGPLVQRVLFPNIPGVSFDTYGFPEPGLDKTVELLKTTMASRAAMGLTGIYEGHGVSAATIRAYKKLQDAGELAMRVYAPVLFDASLPMTEIEQLFDGITSLSGKGLGDAWFTVGGVSGSVNYPSAKFRPILEAAAARNLRVNAICAGYPIVGNPNPRGMDECLAIMEEVDRKFPIKHLRWVIYHVSSPSPDTFAVMKRLNVVPTSTFNAIHRDGKEHLEKYGEEIATKLLPFKSMMAAGVPVTLGSDLYPPTPMFGLWMAVVRKDARTGRVIGAHEALTRQDALRAYTVNPSYLSFRDHLTGTLEPGKLADVVVLSADLLTVPEAQIGTLRSLLTLVGGKVTHKDAPFNSVVGTVN